MLLPEEHLNGLKRIRLSGQKGINADASYIDGIITIYAVPSDFKNIYMIKPQEKVIRVCTRFGARWENIGDCWYCYWKMEQYKKYILHHVLLHEIGHHMDDHHKQRGSNGKETFAENYAFEMEKIINKTPL